MMWRWHSGISLRSARRMFGVYLYGVGAQQLRTRQQAFVSAGEHGRRYIYGLGIEVWQQETCLSELAAVHRLATAMNKDDTQSCSREPTGVVLEQDVIAR